MKPQLEARVKALNVPLLLVDIVSWGSPVAKQYNIRQLPALWMYRDGAIVSKDSRDVLRRLADL